MIWILFSFCLSHKNIPKPNAPFVHPLQEVAIPSVETAKTMPHLKSLHRKPNTVQPSSARQNTKLPLVNLSIVLLLRLY